MDRAGVGAMEKLALGLARATGESTRTGNDSAGLLGSGASAVLHAQQVKVTAIHAATDAAIRNRGGASAHGPRHRAGWWCDRGTTYLPRSRHLVRRGAGIIDAVAAGSDQSHPGGACRHPASRDRPTLNPAALCAFGM